MQENTKRSHKQSWLIMQASQKNRIFYFSVVCKKIDKCLKRGINGVGSPGATLFITTLFFRYAAVFGEIR